MDLPLLLQAKYTNIQNAIASSDFKSVDKIQIQIENYLKEDQILYIRKAVQLGEDNIEYKYKISKEKRYKFYIQNLDFLIKQVIKKRNYFRNIIMKYLKVIN